MSAILQGFQRVFAGDLFEAGAVELVGEGFGLNEVAPCSCGFIAHSNAGADEVLK